VPPHAFEVPTTTVEFYKDNEIGRRGIVGQRVNVETIDLRALLRLLKRGEVEIRLIVFGRN
jgi:hypothetical protein